MACLWLLLLMSSRLQSKGSRATCWVALSCSTQHVAIKHDIYWNNPETQHVVCYNAQIVVKITQKIIINSCQKSDIARHLPIIKAQPFNQYIYCSITKVSLVSILLDRPEERGDICQFIAQISSSIFWVFHLYSGYFIYIPTQIDIFVKRTHLLYMYENSARFNEAEEHSILFTLYEEKDTRVR